MHRPGSRFNRQMVQALCSPHDPESPRLGPAKSLGATELAAERRPFRVRHLGLIRRAFGR